MLLSGRLTVIRLLPVLAVLPVMAILRVSVVPGPWRRRGVPSTDRGLPR